MESSKGKLIRSLRFKLCLVMVLIGIIYTAFSCYRSYNKAMNEMSVFVDEELAQIANVIIDYDVILPSSWKGPSIRRRIFRDRYGNLVIQDHEVQNSFLPIPSLTDLFNNHQEIIIAPLYAKPGEPQYFPRNIEDGLYSVLIQDRRVRAYVATNKMGVRFVVARPFTLMEAYVNKALLSSLFEFLILVAIYVPCIILFVNLIFLRVNRAARELDSRRESDLTPVKNQKLPSELDVFIESINTLFDKTSKALSNERRFIADAAHEMRTPLTAISLQAQAIDESVLEKNEAEKVRQLKLAIARQRKLTNDLLAYARSQCGKELHLATFDVKTLFVEIIEDLGYLADKKDIDLGLVGDCNLSLYSDRASVKTIVSNLVSNALKYTPEHGQCDLSCIKNEKGTYIFIEDNGPGINADDLEKVFNAFYRVGGDTSKIEGTGLGLAIVKSAADEIGAKIKLENRKPHGLKAILSFRN